MNKKMSNKQAWVIGTAVIVVLLAVIYFCRGQRVQAAAIGGGTTIISGDGSIVYQGAPTNTGSDGSASTAGTPGTLPGPTSVPTSAPLQQY